MDDDMDDLQESIPPTPNGDIVPVKQSLSDLDPIKASLYNKIKLAKTPEETQNYLNLINQREQQIAQREYRNFQLSEGKNQIKYERKIAVYKESITVVFSIISIVLGMLTTNSIPLIGPLLILLGLIKPLGYSIGEVVELLGGLTESRKLPQGEATNNEQEASESSE